MIRTFIGKLQQTHVITSASIQDLRNAINSQYKKSGKEYKAKIFAGSIHRLIDSSLEGLHNDTKIILKNQIIRKNMIKRFTELSLYDILCTYVSHFDRYRPYSHNLSLWIKHQTDLDLSRISIRKVIQAVKKEEMIKKTRHNSKYSKNAARINALKKFIAIGLSGFILAAVPSDSLKTGDSIIMQLQAENSQMSETTNLKKSYRLHETGRHISIAINKAENITVALEIVDTLSKGSEIDIEYMVNETLPEDIRYEDININKIKKFLKSRNSILVNEPYFTAILTTAKAYDINPKLLFAITGQEQSLVPESGRNALSIANNPFNVHYSWQKYNTNIVDSTQIAANTIIRLAKGCPENEDPIKWINRKYAEDQNWWKGVKTYISLMDKAAG